jgi:hypothetical protein
MKIRIRRAFGHPFDLAIQSSQVTSVVAGIALACLAAAPAGAQNARSGQAVPAEQTAAAVADPSWDTPRMSWGDPDLEGTFTSRDMSGVPMERAAQYGTQQSLTTEQFLQRASGGGGGLGALRGGEEFEGRARLQLSALDSGETGTRSFGYTSYIIDPEDGRMPGLTAEGRARQAGRGGGGQANGPFYTMEDFSYYDRCITRGIVGSITPSLYGDAMRIVQSPTEVAISYEMLHDTRVIPLDGRPQADPGVRQYMGSSVGHFDGDTLVIVTTNLTEDVGLGRYLTSEDAVLTERITRIDPDMINYVVTVDDPRTYERPWTVRMTLTTQPDYEILEYSCHEGNFFVANALRAEKLYQDSVAEAIAAGEPVPARAPTGGGGFSEIYTPPSSEEAFDINAGE